ncbi:hypothetical protein VTJ49DRAFT_1025 [Mycothermus thermophilus]|uniref:Succinate dehydrogenase assembly factor 4, mitochondrial n=1 Tax=Humicola insolens TaxID=85995 RepID=A0ABR3VE38_HUMIN
MASFTLRSVRRAPMLASALRRQALAAPQFHTSSPTQGDVSSPKSAEGPSATSGGSRSKEAVETGSSPTAGAILPDALATGDVRGATGGGPPLESSRSPPPQPKITNASVPGHKVQLTPEQQAEVDEHNREFEKKHGRADPAENDKVDKSFWSGRGSRFGNP